MPRGPHATPTIFSKSDRTDVKTAHASRGSCIVSSSPGGVNPLPQRPIRNLFGVRRQAILPEQPDGRNRLCVGPSSCLALTGSASAGRVVGAVRGTIPGVRRLRAFDERRVSIPRAETPSVRRRRRRPRAGRVGAVLVLVLVAPGSWAGRAEAPSRADAEQVGKSPPDISAHPNTTVKRLGPCCGRPTAERTGSFGPASSDSTRERGRTECCSRHKPSMRPTQRSWQESSRIFPRDRSSCRRTTCQAAPSRRLPHWPRCPATVRNIGAGSSRSTTRRGTPRRLAEYRCARHATRRRRAAHTCSPPSRNEGGMRAVIYPTLPVRDERGRTKTAP